MREGSSRMDKVGREGDSRVEMGRKWVRENKVGGRETSSGNGEGA